MIYIISDLILHAYERSRQVIRAQRAPDRRRCTFTDLIVHAPDLSPEDNHQLASAAQALTASLAGQRQILGDSEHFRRMALRIYTKFLEEDITVTEFEAIINGGQTTNEQTAATPDLQYAGRVEPDKHPTVDPVEV
jgi:hypothetical protein